MAIPSSDELLAEAGREIFSLLTRKRTLNGHYGPGDIEYYHLPLCNAGDFIDDFDPEYGAPCSEHCKHLHDLLRTTAKALRVRVMTIRGLRKLKLS